jgi:hypothetical protein
MDFTAFQDDIFEDVAFQIYSAEQDDFLDMSVVVVRASTPVHVAREERTEIFVRSVVDEVRTHAD